MDTQLDNNENKAYRVILKSSIADNKVSLELLENILQSHGYENTQYLVMQSKANVRLEVNDNNAKRLDDLVNQLFDNELLASNDKEFLSWF